MKLSDIAELNPKRTLKKGTVAPFVEMAALPTNAKNITEITQKTFSGSGSKFKNGDTLFARITPCLENGKTALITELNDEEIAHGSTEFIVISPKNISVDMHYIYYLARLPEFREYARSRMEGTSGRQRVSWQSLAEFEFNFPNEEKRKVIGEKLSLLDEKITLNTQTNQTLEQIAQAIFKHWFIDFAPIHAKANALARGETTEQAELAAMACLSGKTVEKITALKTQDPTAYHQLQQTAAAFPSEFVETEMGQVPKGWEVLKFKDFVKETKEKVGKLQGIEEYSVGNEGIYPRKEKYKKQLAKDPSKNKLIREANIVFGMGNKEVNWGIMRDKIGSVSSAYNIFQINDINHLFLDMFINNIPYYFRDIIKPTSRQGQTIDKEAFLEKAIYYPNKEIINIFLEKITQINELSICIKSQNIYLLSIRDYLLPKLLGGEIKL